MTNILFVKAVGLYCDIVVTCYIVFTNFACCMVWITKRRCW